MRVDFFELLSEGVEETPGIAGLELLVLGFPPVSQNRWDLACRDGTAIGGPDHEVMGTTVGEPEATVALDPVIKFHKFGAELADGASSELPEIPGRKPCVFPTDLDEATERQVIADENLGASYEAGWEGFVVAVA